MNGQDRDDSVTLELLQAIDQRSDLTQRHLADRLGIALGLANAYLKRCVRKGLIKVQQAPANRYLYYLTPQGFAEKSRLTAQYLSDSLVIYRRASADFERIYDRCEAEGLRRLVYCGASDLAEIASIRARGRGVEILGIVDPECGSETFADFPVWQSCAAAPACDAYVFTALKRPAEFLCWLQEDNRARRPLLIPQVLGLPGARARNAAAKAKQDA
jgi:DNA-binding MarR family transcriptional regulator